MTYDSKIHTYDLHRYTLKNLSFLSLFCPSTGEGRIIRLPEVSTVRWNLNALNDHIGFRHVQRDAQPHRTSLYAIMCRMTRSVRYTPIPYGMGIQLYRMMHLVAF